MTRSEQHFSRPAGAHVAWIDCAKGLTIVLVVLLYANEWAASALGDEGWLRPAVDFAAPFRMPGFFLISGLLLSFSMQRDWQAFLDRKVLHFAYFYVLWLTILVAFEAPWTVARHGWSELAALYFKAFVRPYSMLWFIYVLPIFFVLTRLVQRAPVLMVWTFAAALQIAQVETGIKVVDKLTPYYVFFYSGYVLAPHVFRLAGAAPGRPALAMAALGAWAPINLYVVLSGYAGAPGVALVLGMLGAGAMVLASSLLQAARAAAPLAYAGRKSLVIYLGFYIPLVVAGELAVSSGWISDSAALVLVATAGAISGPLVLFRLVRNTRLAFLFERPELICCGRARRSASTTGLRPG